ncbi:MAG TPA: hypothetical protein VFG10_09695 [Saprospiraceae bacterium]|nr:hypothetical protein [Saprospiraceae bacterium]
MPIYSKTEFGNSFLVLNSFCLYILDNPQQLNVNQGITKIKYVTVEEKSVNALIRLLPDNLDTLRNLEYSNLKNGYIEKKLYFANEFHSVSNGEVFLVSFESDVEQTKKAILSLIAIIGNSIMVEANISSFWYRLEVDLDASIDAGSGIGENPLHIDMLTFKNYPKGMVIYCERPDSKNGGETLLAPLNLYSFLPIAYANVLMKPSFSYWQDKNLEQIGDHLNQFSVLPTMDDDRVRFTAKLPKWINNNNQEKVHYDRERMLESIYYYDCLLKSNCIRLSLQHGQAVIFSQLHFAHGRSTLGSGQVEIPTELRRLLWRSYFNY